MIDCTTLLSNFCLPSVFLSVGIMSVWGLKVTAALNCSRFHQGDKHVGSQNLLARHTQHHLACTRADQINANTHTHAHTYRHTHRDDIILWIGSIRSTKAETSYIRGIKADKQSHLSLDRKWAMASSWLHCWNAICFSAASVTTRRGRLLCLSHKRERC